MKTKKRKPVTDFTNTCSAERPLWETAKTKHAAYFQGQQKGYNIGRKEAQDAFATEKKALNEEERKVMLAVLQQIGQAGSSIVEAMARALMSYNKQL